MEPRTSGIYIIRNKNTGKSYVGGSTWVEQRLAQHRCMMADGCHPNPRLRGAVEASGLDRFEFGVIEVVPDASQLADRELVWIRRLDAVRRGYNMTERTEHYATRADGSERWAAAGAAREPWDNRYELWSWPSKVALAAGFVAILVLVF